MQMYATPVNKAFGMPEISDRVMVDVFPVSDLVPAKDKDYHFDKEVLMLALSFITSPYTGDGLYVYGEFGTGKTSSIGQILSRLNYPTLMLSWDENADSADLIGSMGISFGDTTFNYGPLALAMKEGYALVINEIDRGRGGNLVALNDVLDSGVLVIKETNEVIRPHPNFRLFVTANSAGSGDTTGKYVGSIRRLDPAFLDRFQFLKIDYMSPMKENAAMHKLFPDMSQVFIQKMVEFANSTRKTTEDDVSDLGIPMSTRTLKRSLRILHSYGIGLENRPCTSEDLLVPLNSSYMARLDDVGQDIAKTLLKTIFG